MRRISIFYLFIFCLLTPLCWAKCLTLEEVIEIAIDQNPVSLAAEYGIEIAQETTQVARAAYDPQMTLRAVYNRFQRYLFRPNISLSTPAQIPIQVTVDIAPIIGPYDDWAFGFLSRYIIYDSGKRHARLDAALAQEGVAIYEAKRARQGIILNASVAFYNLLSNMESVTVAQDQLKRAERHLKIAQARKETGFVPVADVYRVEAQLAAAKQAFIHAETQVTIAKGTLNIAMGLPPYSCIEIVREDKTPLLPQNSWLSNAFEEACNNRPEILVALERIKAARALVRDAKADGGIKFAAEAGFGFRDQHFFPQHKEWVVGVAAEYPLYRGFGIVHNVRKTQAQVSALLEDLERISLQVQQEVWNSFARLKEVYDLLNAIEARIKAANEALRLTEERYEVGAGTVTEMLDAQTVLTQAESSYVEAEWNYFIALTAFRWSQGHNVYDCPDEEDDTDTNADTDTDTDADATECLN